MALVRRTGREWIGLKSDRGRGAKNLPENRINRLCQIAIASTIQHGPNRITTPQKGNQMTDVQLPATGESVEPDAPEEDAFTLDEVEKRYFAPDQLTTAQEYLSKVVEVAETGQLKRNFDPGAPFPDGYGLAVVPLSKRVEGKGNVTVGVAIAAIPDPELVGAHEKGAEFIRDCITAVFMAKVANACRPRVDGSTAPSIPYEITDFLESRRGRENLKAFSEIAPIFVKALRKKGIKYMSAQLLRQTLQSKQFAEAQFEKIPQEAWGKVLDGMIVKAKSEGHDPAILVNWKETRESTAVAEIEDIALEEFDNLV